MVKGSCWPVLSIRAMVALTLMYNATNSRWIRILGWPMTGTRRLGPRRSLMWLFSDSDGRCLQTECVTVEGMPNGAVDMLGKVAFMGVSC